MALEKKIPISRQGIPTPVQSLTFAFSPLVRTKTLSIKIIVKTGQRTTQEQKSTDTRINPTYLT